MNDYESTNTAMVGMTVTFKNSTLTSYLVQWRELHDVGTPDVLTPDGKLWTGGGRNNDLMPPNNLLWWWGYHAFTELTTKLSSNWENRMKAGIVDGRRYSVNSEAYNLNYNWTTQNYVMNAREDNYNQQYFTFLEDMQGNYSWGPIKNIDAFGWGIYDYVLRQKLWPASNVPTWTASPGYSAAAGGVVVPLASAASVNSIVMPTWQQYDTYPPANEGIHNEQLVWDFYWQHTVDIIPNWLTLIGGWSYSGITTFSVTNVSSLPWVATQTPAQSFVHRLGAVLKVTKDISLYAMQGTSFTPPGSGNVLETGQLPPVLLGRAQELGLKTAFMNGRLSSDFAWFIDTTTNVEVFGGVLPSGLSYYTLIGSTVQEGVDGDVSFAIIPGWQVIGSFYAGHNRDQAQKPVAASYDNSWSFFTRYDFQRDSILHRVGFGTGVTRVGGRWLSTSGITGAAFTPYEIWSGQLKMFTGTSWDGFLTYTLDKHLTLRLRCTNILSSVYSVGATSAVLADPSTPRTFFVEADYKF